jgi:recombination protein RecA
MSGLDLKSVLLDSSNVGSDDSKFDLHDRRSSGIDAYDVISGGGWYSGRLYHMSGPKSSGKSTMLLQTMSHFNKKYGGVCVHAESESTLDMDRAEIFGLDRSMVILPSRSIWVIEDGFEWITNQARKIRKAYPDLPISLSWDTIASTITKAQYASGHSRGEKVKEIDQFAGGRQEKPRVLTTKLPELIDFMNSNNMFSIFLNQVYDSDGYGDDAMIAPGGNALHHHMTTHIRFIRRAVIYNKDATPLPIGLDVEIKTIKNKQAPEKQVITIPLFYSTGFCNEIGLFRLAQSLGVIQVSSNGWVTGNKPYGVDTSFRTSEMGSKGELIFDTPFYGWMLANCYRKYAFVYPSLLKRYTAIADDIDLYWKGRLDKGESIHRDKSSVKEEIFTYE